MLVTAAYSLLTVTLIFCIVRTLSPLLKGRRTFQKLSHLGVQNFLLERGVDVEMGDLPLFKLLYSSVQLHLHFQIFLLLS